MQVRWTLKALVNLNDAVEYIAADNPTAAAEVTQRIWDAAQRVIRQPGIGRPGKISRIRELVIPGLPYVLPYVEKEGAVIILRVMHTSMKRRFVRQIKKT
ncbi:MAG: type II toxin-antitoxin system RelE/ParE family toxin [Deltaproteobacteria bacterium]|jgi:plasmid stabilization system protein ParE|nr:type II toxin-antitoxin system RelE/ParE family toxin [Deltaproteobacteria bacterium]MDX9762787.1 type II toxin-antitoxin system RelE/ParE family toxin [Desulfomonilia bacterium]